MYDQRAWDKAVVVNVRHQIDLIRRDKAIMKRVVGRVLEWWNCCRGSNCSASVIIVVLSSNSVDTLLWNSSVSPECPDQSSYERRCGQLVGISTEIADPSLVGWLIVFSLMCTTCVLTRVHDATHICDVRFIYSFICEVHQTAFSLMYKLVRTHPIHDADNSWKCLKTQGKSRPTICIQTRISHSRTWIFLIQIFFSE